MCEGRAIIPKMHVRGTTTRVKGDLVYHLIVRDNWLAN
jgi:hypothetical protein